MNKAAYEFTPTTMGGKPFTSLNELCRRYVFWWSGGPMVTYESLKTRDLKKNITSWVDYGFVARVASAKQPDV